MPDWLIIVFIPWALLGGLCTAALFADGSKPPSRGGVKWIYELPSSEARLVVGIGFFLTFPLILWCAILYGMFEFVKAIGLGTRDVLRHVLPRKTTLPKAQVRK